MENTTALNGTLCVTNWTQEGQILNVIEIVFNDTEKALWKQAASYVEEYRSYGLLPIVQFKDNRGTRQLQISDSDIDMIKLM
jgi:hypothetical protein